MKISLVTIDLNSLKGEGDNTTGLVCISLEGDYFPEKDWNDFVVTILLWWLEQATKINNGSSSQEDFLFMDGPFYFTIKKNISETTISFHENGKVFLENKVIHWDYFYDSLISSSKSIINLYSEKKILLDKSLIKIKSYL